MRQKVNANCTHGACSVNLYMHMSVQLGLKKQLEDDSDLIESLLDTMHVTGLSPALHYVI